MDDSRAAASSARAWHNRFARADLLYQQSRYEDAERELRRLLADAPDDPLGHAMLSMTLGALDRLDEATAEAEQAIALAPEMPLGHAALGSTMLARRRPAETLEVVNRGLAFAAEDPQLRYLRAVANERLERFDAALDDVSIILARNADHLPALTLRTALLRRLGRLDEAAATNDEALRIDAENSQAHTNRGWVVLERGDAAAARQAFAEALRLDPNNDHARAGLVEAIKGTSWLYRQFLRYAFWSQKLTRGGGWLFLIGTYGCFRLLMWTMQAYPQWTIVLGPLVALYIAAAIVSWLAVPISNLLLRLHRDGRLALTTDDKRSSELVGGVLAIAAGVFAYGIATEASGVVAAAFGWVILALPTAVIMSCEWGWPRWTLAGGCLAAAAILAMATATGGLLPATLARLLPMLLIGLQFAAYPLSSVELKR